MVETRRKSRAANVENDAGPEEHFTVPIPDDLDVQTLESIVPDIDLHSPSPQAVVSLYRFLLQQASELDTAQRELDDARAEVEKKDVELDQALQDKESGYQDLESQVESLQAELKQVKQERDQLLASQNELQTRISTLSSSQTSSSAEVDTLKHRLEDVEREKRDLVTVIGRLRQEGEQQEQEIQTLRSNLKEAREEHQTLETQVREIRSGEASSKFKLDSLSQQLQLAQSETERLNAELTSKTDQYANYRRTKQAEIVTLQSTVDDLTQKHSSLETSMTALQSSYNTQNHQLAQALTKVQDLTGQLAEQEATYSAEANSLRRLVTMLEDREKQAKEIVENLEREWDDLGQRHEVKANALREEAEREKRKRENAEKKISQLEKVVEKMGRGELPLPGGDGPSTPSRRASAALDEVSDGLMGLSPTVAMASRVQKSGKSFTQVYSEYVQLQEDYARKCAECQHMDETLTAVLAQIEERAPVLSQQRLEYERLQAEASQLASELAQALSDRDSQTTLAQETAQRLTKSTRENELLQVQLNDLGRQVRNLLREIGRRDDPNLPSDEEMEGVAPAEDVEAVITNHLVLFKSIDGLQEQNQKLLSICRELGQKMESEERDYRETLEKEQDEAIREAHEAMQELAGQLERQKKSSDAVIQAYVKERDALKSMLARAEKSGAITMNGDSGEGGPSSELAKELAEVQSQFDAYRMEMGHDSGRLREEMLAAQREVAQLQAAVAKANAKIEYMNERNRMSQEQFNMNNRELDDLRSRNQKLLDQFTRVDIDHQRASEELVAANGRAEQLRNECANLRAEKKIWESIQTRLVEENKTLAMERSHLSDLMNNVQRMHNDLERSGENDRRRLENQLQMLENQASELRTQLSQERDTIRNLTLQKDIEVRDLQTRLDKVNQELSKTRESLVIAETSKTHLEERIGDLTKHLQGNEEKLAVYERRSGTTTTSAGSTTTAATQDMSREQQLEAEVAELRSKLKVTELDLNTARSHVEQFKEISQANETALGDLNTTFDAFKSSTEAQIARLESERAGLEEKLTVAQQALVEMTTERNQLQSTYENERVEWANDKKLLEDMIADLSSSTRMSDSEKASHENDLKQQEERAKAAEERYSNEVVAHAETIKSLDSLKKQLSTVQATVREHQTAAETANAKLATSQSSWNQQKEALDKEVSDLKDRYTDIKKQNDILHKHLESVSSQAARIRQAADSNVPTEGEGEASSSTDGADAKLSELRSVVAYLRKEKEIVDLQLELSKQENTRLKTQIDHLQQTLNETRQTLSEERERAVENAASVAQHNELVERINQLNILRESNATLRADCENHQKRSKELEERLRALHRQLEPVKEEARTAKAELQAKEAQVKRLEEENKRWQERNQQLLGKYDRIDPSEMQALKDEIEQLKKQKDEVQGIVQQRDEELKSLKEHVEKVEKSLRDHRETLLKTNQNFKARMGELNAARSTLTAQKNELEAKVAAMEKEQQELQASKVALEARIAALETEKSALVAGGASAGQPDPTQQATIMALQEERDKLLAERASWSTLATADPSASGTTDEQARQAWETEKATLIKDRDDALSQVQTATAEAERANTLANNRKAAFDKLRMDAVRIRTADQEKAAAEKAAAVEQAKNEMQAAAAPPDEQVKKLQEELKSLEQRLAQKHQQELKAAVEAAKKEASSSGTPEAAIVEREAKLQEEIAAAVERGRMEGNSKVKLKDAQILRIQNRLKEYEAQVLAWKEANLLPQDVKLPGPAARPPPANAAASTSGTPATPSTSTPSTNTLPRKPPAQTTAQPAPANPAAGTSAAPTGTPAATPGAGRGRGIVATNRGAARGLPIRGAAAGRGGGPVASAAKPGQPLSGGVQIHGAANANKRPAVEPAESDSLAKRLKPAAAPGGPVKLNRPGPPPT